MSEDHQDADSLQNVYDNLIYSLEYVLDMLMETNLPRLAITDASVWLENLIATLESWAVDIRASLNTLRLIENIPIGLHVRNCLMEIDNQVHDAEHLARAFISEQQPQDPILDDKDQITVTNVELVSSTVKMLQGLVVAIRMVLASDHSIGPYKRLKSRIDRISSEYEISSRNEPLPVEEATNPKPLQNADPFARPIVSDGKQSSSKGSGVSDAVMLKTESVSRAEDADSKFHDSAESKKWASCRLELIRARRKNWMGAFYFVTEDLLEIFQFHTIQALFSGITTGEMLRQWLTTSIKILAVCVYADTGPTLFVELDKGGFKDHHLPLGRLSSQISTIQGFQAFSNSQWLFLSHEFDWQNQTHLTLNPRTVVPILYQCDSDSDADGRGSWGDVFKVQVDPAAQHNLKKRYNTFALKRFSGRPQSLESTLLATEKLNLRHPNLLERISSWTQSNETYILFDSPAYSLENMLDSAPPLLDGYKTDQIIKTLHGLVSGILVLYENAPNQLKIRGFEAKQSSYAVYHLDLKPEGILIFQPGSIEELWKIGDLGFESKNDISCRSPETHPSVQDSAVLGRKFDLEMTRKTDVWSFGCIMLEVVSWLFHHRLQLKDMSPTGQVPTIGNAFWYQSATNESVRLRPEVEETFKLLTDATRSTVFQSLLPIIKSMLTVNVQDRPNLFQIERDIAMVLKSFHWTTPIDTAPPETKIEIYLDSPVSDSSSTSDGGGDLASSLFENDHSRASTPFSSYSEDESEEYGTNLVGWQERAIYPLLAHGLEPVPIFNSIQTDFKSLIDIEIKKITGKLTSETQLTDPNHIYSIQKSIIRSLEFPEARARQVSIQQAHSGTCQWILSQTQFLEWYKGESDATLWIRGNPGSGKTTLLKFMCEHLEQVAETSIHTSSLQLTYFANSEGTLLQKSSMGLLRSLIAQIFRQRRDLIQLTLPDLWKSMLYTTDSFLSELKETWHHWTVLELKTLWERIFLDDPRSKNLVIFVDASDEFEGDDDELQGVLRFITSFEHVKLCVASRPQATWSRFCRDIPFVSIAELTEDDISIYVRQRLEGIQQSGSESSQHSDELMAVVMRRTEGSFLWARLICDHLLREAERGNLHEPVSLLYVVPKDLEDVYQNLSSKIDSRFQIEAARTFQLLLAQPRIETSQLTILTGNDLGMSIDTDILHGELIKKINFDFASQRLSRYGGLVEIVDNDVQFIHHSVQEFLSSPKQIQTLEQITSGSGFDPYIGLLQSNILMLYSKMEGSLEWRLEMQKYVRNAMHYARLVEEKTGKRPGALVDALESLIEDFLKKVSKATKVQESFLTYAIIEGLVGYVDVKLSDHSARKFSTTPLLIYATLGPLHHHKFGFEHIPMIKTLLDRGEDPNGPSHDATVWRTLIAYSDSEEQEDKTNFSAEVWREICRAFIEFGADREPLRSEDARYKEFLEDCNDTDSKD